MWKSAAGHNVSTKVAAQGGGDDDWETDPDFENDVSEQEQRWGAKTVPGSGHKEPISVSELRAKVAAEHEQVKHQETTPKASYGYGGKFGVETDHVDKVAVGHDYVAQVQQHTSQKDAAKGFGGKFGMHKQALAILDRIDKSAVGFEYKGEVKQHTSQKDYSKGFGGKYGVEHEKVGSDYKGQTDYLAGFGGRYGVQKERMDKSAVDFSDTDSPVSAYEKTQPIEASAIANAGKLKALFESLAKADNDDDNTRTVQKEKSRRKEQEKRERQEAEHKQQEQTSRDEQLHLADVPQVLAECQSSLDIRHNTAEEAQAQLKTCDTEFLALLVRSDHFLQPDCRPPPPVEDVYRQVTVDDEYEVVAPTPPSTAGEEQQVCTETSDDSEDLSAGVRAVAIYNYQGEDTDEMSFNPDDVVTDIEMIDEGWWKGRCHGRTGLFPAAYVRLMQ
ncbi:src substrate protein p85-like isoform X3 [Festucalex cinctus]